MGANDGPHPEDGEGPARQVFVDPFSISATAVTNAEFAEFVRRSEYKTLAEQEGWSFVFHLLAPDGSDRTVSHAPWWRRVDGACWSAPCGPESSIDQIADHPVVHIALADAMAYARWVGVKLPTEAQWEFAARGGLHGQAFPRGNRFEPSGKPEANIWRGRFPDQPDGSNVSVGTAPSRAFRPNGFGIYNTVGNVWEWTADRFTRLHGPRPLRNPRGPLNGNQQVAKGGSYLCHPSYCLRYRTSSRQALNPETTAGNVGFRISG